MAFRPVLRLPALPQRRSIRRWRRCSVISEVFRVFHTQPQDFPRLTWVSCDYVVDCKQMRGEREVIE